MAASKCLQEMYMLLWNFTQNMNNLLKDLKCQKLQIKSEIVVPI